MRLLFIIDAPSALNAKKDSTIALMRAAAQRGDEVHCAEMRHLFITDGTVQVHAETLTINSAGGDNDSGGNWRQVRDKAVRPTTDYDAVLMRKEPPVDEDFIMATRLLDIVQRDTLVANAPQALRDQNEKLSIFDFPDLIAPTWVGADAASVAAFRQQHGSIVLKPLNGMGGQGIYISGADDMNFHSVFDLLSVGGRRLIMAQAYLPAARAGDFRVFAAGGKVLPWMLARLPREDDHRGNLAAGGTAEARPLDAAAEKIASIVAPVLAERGVYFAGLDVIGGKLIEINITCPTGLREVHDQSGYDAPTAALAAMCKIDQ